MRGPTENTMLLPDRIYLFRGPLIEDFDERDELIEEIRVTLFHELGHMIGLDEDDMEERGID
jgi:predicted Zn-dependent protease with MMP-like domain